MALTADEQDLVKVARETLPALFADDARQLEDFIAFAKTHGPSLKVIRDWIGRQALITTADGATTALDGHTLTPDWLNQHARDRDTSRASGETDAQLRDRIRLRPIKLTGGDTIDPSDAVTRKALLDNAKLILDGEGLSALFGSVALVELPRDAAYAGRWSTAAGAGGTFYKSGSTMTFVPTVRFPYAPWQKTAPDASAPPTETVPDPTKYPFGDPEDPPVVNPTDTPPPPGSEKAKSGEILSYNVQIVAASSGGNNGTFVTTGLGSGSTLGDGVTYANAGGVAGSDPTVGWTLQRIPVYGITPGILDGSRMAFCSRGYRASGAGATVVLICGYIADPVQRAKVRGKLSEMLRLRAGAGVRRVVEIRANP